MSPAAHAAREEQGTGYRPDPAPVTIMRAQRIRVTAVSGSSPKACATRAAQPGPP